MRIYHTLRMQRKYPLLLIVALLVAWGSLPIAAQNATISPSLGNLISAFTHNPHEVGFEGGYGSLWQHKQLPIHVRKNPCYQKMACWVTTLVTSCIIQRMARRD